MNLRKAVWFLSKQAKNSRLTFIHRPSNYEHIAQSDEGDSSTTTRSSTSRPERRNLNEKAGKSSRKGKRHRSWLAGKVWELVGTKCRTRKGKPWRYTSLGSQMEQTNTAMDFLEIVEIVNEEQSRNRSVGRRKVLKFVVVVFFLSVIPGHRLKGWRN